MSNRITAPNVTKFEPNVYYCKRAKGELELDGNLDKEFWADAQWTSDFVDIEGNVKPTPRYRTRVKMLWDDKAIYFGAELEGDEIWGHVTKRDDVIFRDNDFEIFIDPDSDTHLYCEFEMNVLNTVWDLLLTKPYRDKGKPMNGFDIKGLRTAVKVDGEINNPAAQNKKWSLEIVMPFETLLECNGQGARLPRLGDYWRINFSRVQWLVDVVDGQYQKRIRPGTNQPYPEDNWVWSPQGIVNMHCPETWGFVFFSDGREDYTIPEDEKLKWELRKLYYKQHSHFYNTGHFAAELPSDTEGFAPKIQTTDNWFEMSCPSSDGKRRLTIYADGRTEERITMKILGYVGGSTIVTEEDAKALTHINVAFAHLNMDGSIDVKHLKIMEQMKQIREWNPEIKIVASVVPKQPDAFTACSADQKLREAVGRASAALITEHGFDGVDFDWEYPCVPSNGMNCSPADKHNFTLLCKEVRKAVGNGLVTIAAGADLYFVDSVELPELAEILDYICLMTYDLKCGFHALAGHHTQLFSSTGDVFRNSCDQALRLFHASGVPKEKLLMGAAFYSRKWENIQDRNHGLLQICKNGGGYGPDYGILVDEYIDKNGYTRYWDDEAKAPYLFNGSTFLSYDDEESIRCKCDYIKENGYGGIFYWEHKCDPTRALLTVIKNSLGNRAMRNNN